MKFLRILLISLLLNGSGGVMAHNGEALRRVISVEQPAWIVHIDVWNYADPQKIIDMVPEDIRPWVIFNIATSSNDEKSADGPAIYDSWMKVCAQNRVWTMIQCASGAVNRMPDDGSTTAYEQYFKDYPNFLGFNFAEQFWGFGSNGQPTFSERLQLFADLMPICHKYGGYLAVSFCDSYYSAAMMPLAYLKRNSQMREFLESDGEHFLCFEKYTLKKNFLDIESNCLGMWLGGYAGQYGIRFDSSGWLNAGEETDQTKGGTNFVRAAGAIPIVEHLMLTGETMVDGPELTWTECSKEGSTTTSDGYTCRNWEWMPQYENISMDLFRKVLDGTFRIPTRAEVMRRTKVCIVNDISKNLDRDTERDSYLTPRDLFDGLYRSEQDQGGAKDNHWIANRWWMKTTGRYPSIPQVYKEVEGLTAFKKSTFNKSAFDSWMKETFAEEYSGDIYAGRHENGWVTYNPYQYDESTDGEYRVCGLSTRRAEGSIPLQYNTCECITLNYAPYSLGVIKETTEQIDLYLTNYQTTGTLSEDIITIAGSTGMPRMTWKDRGNHVVSSVSTTWEDGIYTIRVKHNGPVELLVSCSGEAKGRKNVYTAARIQKPAAPSVYEGTLQYEAELADYQNTTIRKSGSGHGRDGYQGQGFAELTSEKSKLRFRTAVPQTDYYLLTLRYQADTDGSITVNDEILQLTKSEEWNSVSFILQQKEGANSVVIQNTGGGKVIIDNIQLKVFIADAFTPDASGEYHVNLSSLMADGSLSITPEGIVTQAAGGSGGGTLRLFLDHADFSEVTSLKVMYDGDGDIFRYLVISDNAGNSVNPDSYKGGFWSSKYNLNYVDYQLADASRKVCKLEWVADEAKASQRSMSIKDILIRTSATTGVEKPTADRRDGRVYDLLGRQVTGAYKGIMIVRSKDGKATKRIYQ